MTIVTISKTAMTEARIAALLRYEDNLETPDRPGWTGGKCPKTEYFGNMGEIGGALFLGQSWRSLCLYSESKADYKKPDVGPWEIKAGDSFTDSDIRKGAKYILWVKPVEDKNKHYYCKYTTCPKKIHFHLTGDVEILGWTDVATDPRERRWGKYKPVAMRSLDTMPDWQVAA